MRSILWFSFRGEELARRDPGVRYRVKAETPACWTVWRVDGRLVGAADSERRAREIVAHQAEAPGRQKPLDPGLEVAQGGGVTRSTEV